MIAHGFRSTLACIDPRNLPPTFVGREFDIGLLSDLPPAVDSCGERVEFHTFCHASPVFDRPIPVRVGDVVERNGFWFADLLSADGRADPVSVPAKAELQRDDG